MPCQSACRPDIHSRHIAHVRRSRRRICNLARIDPHRIVPLDRGAARSSLSLSLSLSLFLLLLSRSSQSSPLDAALYAALDIRGDPMETLRPDNALGRFN